MNRTCFLVDGFNLYHSLRAASDDLGGASTKWLDLRALLQAFLPALGNRASLQRIYYFSALANHLEKRQPGLVARHQAYIECLEHLGIVPVLGRFKPKLIRCHHCGWESRHFEEKETDVAISIKLLEIFHGDEADTVALVTGDTDLAPAVRRSKILFPEKQVWFLFPYKRRNNELARIADGHCSIRKERYLQHQFPPRMCSASGKILRKPEVW
ncbi:NYN domain-containing protein [bacterium]|nr:NYN domain-containing protein [bacterium]